MIVLSARLHVTLLGTGLNMHDVCSLTTFGILNTEWIFTNDIVTAL